MKIEVFADRTIGSLQEEFTQKFPYLKLVFFSRPHGEFEGSPAKFILNKPQRTLGSIEKQPQDGNLDIDGSTPTWMLEKMFEDQFGLHVQVFRKSGSLWLETSRTDRLTLEEQNRKGRASEHIETEEETERDYHEQE